MSKRSEKKVKREVDGFLHRHGYNPGRWAGTRVQSLLFDRALWSASSAKEWAKEHHFHAGKVHVTDDYVRLRQLAPTRGKEKRTVTFGEGIKAIVEQL